MIKGFKVYKFLFCFYAIILLLTGCSGSKNNPVSNLTGEISQKEIAEIISLAPTRNELKDIIITEINGTLPSESPIRRAPGSYFFTLSQASVEVNGNTAEVKYNFIYIENYGSPSEEYYEGIITVSYLKETTPFVTWVKTGVTVELTEITKGTIKGTVINGITENPMENVVVYASSGEERTKAVKTDSTGQYEITGVLENTYTVNAIYPEFEPNSVKDIVVTANQTTTAATIKMMPGEDNRFVSLEGYVYFDIEETRPVEEAVVLVYTESGELTSLETGITDINGYYKINFIAEGSYEVYASKGLKTNDGQAVTVTANNIQNGTDVTVNNIYLLNSNPEIITVNPLNPVSAEINEELTLTVTAQDEDEDLLYFEWKATGGNLGFSINNTVKWTAETAGSYEVTITVTDKKGGKAEHVFEINVQSEPVELYELNLEVNPVNSGNVTGNGSYEENHEQIITAVAEEGYHFVNWTGDIEHIITGTENNPTVTVKMPAENISLTANFAINQYTLTYIAGTGGSLTGTTTQTINHGGNGTAVTAVPNTGYAFVQWSDGLTSNPRTDTNVTSNKTVTAEFSLLNEITWTFRNSNFDGTIICQTNFANNLWITVGGSGKMTTSNDGINWTQRISSFGTSHIMRINHNNNMWISVGQHGKLATSNDGINWTQQSSSFNTTKYIYDIYYGNNQWIAVGAQGQLATSTDGINWTQRNSSFDTTDIYRVYYGNNIWIAIGENGKMAKSSDGIYWEQIDSSFETTHITSLSFENNLWVAGGYEGKLATSSDGVNWTQRNSNFDNLIIREFDYANNFWIAVGQNGKIAQSNDGITWTQLNSFTTSELASVKFGNSIWITSGHNGILATGE